MCVLHVCLLLLVRKTYILLIMISLFRLETIRNDVFLQRVKNISVQIVHGSLQKWLIANVTDGNRINNVI